SPRCRRNGAAGQRPAAARRARRRCSGRGWNPARVRARRGFASTFTDSRGDPRGGGSDRLAVRELSHRRPPAANRATLRRAPAAPTVPFRPCARGAPAITLHGRDSRTNALPRLDNSQMLRYAGLFTWGAVGLWLL